MKDSEIIKKAMAWADSKMPTSGLDKIMIQESENIIKSFLLQGYFAGYRDARSKYESEDPRRDND